MEERIIKDINNLFTQLFEKMKEEGYEWDAEKKELRKMKQKPKWSNDDKQYLLVCKNALRKYQMSDKWDADIISKWLEDKLKQAEQKTKWTEEDEEMCQETIDWFEKKCFPYALEHENPARECIDWLKSLKHRKEGK